jgi:hypothetical protein
VRTSNTSTDNSVDSTRMQFQRTKPKLDIEPFKHGTLVEKPVRCAQLLCDGCHIRLGGDSGATARALSAVQNGMYMTGVMLQSQKLQQNLPSPFGAA